MDERKPPLDELERKLDRAERLIAALTHNGQDNAGVPGAGPVDRSSPNEREVIEAYIESEENFRNSMDACPLGIRVITAEGGLFYANRAILDIFGYSTVAELDAVSKDQLYTPESYAGHIERKEKRIKGEHVPSEYEISIRRPDGEIRTLQVFRRAITWGGQQQFMALYEDVTERLKMEAALRYHASLVENTTDAVISGDNDLKILSWNKGAELMYGWKAAEVTGKDIQQVVNPAHLLDSHKKFMELLQRNGSITGEDIHHKKSGEPFPVLMTISLIRDLQGSVQGAVTITKDITARQKAEQEIKDRETFLNSVIENTPSPLWVSDANGVIIRMNQALRDLLQVTDEEIIGKYNVLNDAQVREQGFLPLVKQVYEAGKTANFTLDYQTSRVIQSHLANNNHLVLEIVISAVKNAQGQVTNAICQERDITERRKLEASLRLNTQLVHSISDAIISSDENYIINSWNKAAEEMYGWSEAEVLGKTVMEFTTPLFINTTAGEILTGLKKNGYWKGEAIHHRRNGEEIYVSMAISQLKDEYGKDQGAVTVFRDITDRKNAEQALVSSRQRFSGAFHHSPSMNLIINRKSGVIVEVNNAFCQVSGYSREELVGKRWAELNFWYDAEQLVIISRELEQKGAISHAELPFRMKNGNIRHFNGNFTKLNLENEPYIFASGIDITHRKNAEAALIASEKRYRTTLDNMMEGCQIIDRDWRYIYINDASARLGHFDKETLLGRTLIETFADIEKTEIFAAYKKCMEQHIPIHMELETVTPDNKNIWVDLSIQPIPEGIFVLSLDTTERRKADIAIQQSEERFRRVFQSGPLGICVSDLNFGFTMANARFCEIYGYSEEELRSMTFRDFSFPEDMDDTLSQLEMLKKGEIGNFTVERRNIRKNRDVIWCSVTITTLPENAGQPLAYLAMVQDITARKESEDRINTLNQALRSIRNINQLITREKTRDRLIQSVCDNLVMGRSFNSAWIILFDDNRHPVTWAGANMEQSLERLAAVLKKNEFPHCVQKALTQNEVIVTRDPQEQCPGCPALGKTGGTGSMTVKLETGGVLYGVLCGSMRRSVLIDEDEISLFSEVAADISFALRDIELSSSHELLLQEQLRTSKLESIGTLAGGIAHDFNNLLTGIMGNIGLAKEFIEPDSGAFEVLDEAEKAAMRSRELTQQLLTFARGGKPIKKLTDITAVIKDSATFALRGSKARLELSLPPDLWLSEADEGQIGQVVHNLVINADESMAQGGTVMVSAKNLTIDRPGTLPLSKGHYIEIVIQDSGLGISPENLQKIFEPYFTTKQKGSGLGLTSAYSIIKSHGGYLMAESVLNRGSVFHIYLPATRKTAKGEKKVTAKKSAQAGGKVLVMDDDEIIRKMLKNMLNLAGYQAETTADGAEALEKYSEAMKTHTPFFSVIMDLTVPGGMGGKEATAKLLEMDPGALVIVSSGYATDPIMSEYKKYGFSAVIAKPYSIRQLQETLADLAAQKKAPTKGHTA